MPDENTPIALSADATRILAALDSLRRRLLDLTLRNRLLNHRPSKVRGIAVVDEDPRQVFRRVVVEGRAMGFAGRPDPKGQLFPEDAPPPAIAPDTTDYRLNTSYASTPLEDRLLRTWTDARTVLEEQGVNTLFLAIGMLTWLESDVSAKPMRAPVLLVPVSLERGERGRFRLRWSGEDIGGNLSMAVKVKQDYGIEWPTLPDDEDLDLDSYMAAVEHAVRGRKGWIVDREALVVDFFSFAKYLMFKDLDPAVWPPGRAPQEHAVVGGLLSGGLPSDGPPEPVPRDIDTIRPPDAAFEVCDADSSQTVVLLDVASGKHLVVEGPPGTGKSQTIANMVAEAVAAGKTVLFVAEKMAALDVVKRRLDEYKIGDACIELHSHKTRKREMLQELGRTLNLPRVEIAGDGEHINRLLETREKLNAYARELHRAVEPGGWSPFQTQAELARISLRGEPLPRGRFEELAGCSRQDFEERRRAIRNLQSKIQEIGIPCEHPFFGCRPDDLLPGDVPDVATDLAAAREALGALVGAADTLATRIAVNAPRAIRDVLRIIRSAELVAAAPRMVFDLAAPDPRWCLESESILQALHAGAWRQEVRDVFAATLRDDAWGEDVKQLRDDLGRSGDRWTRVFHPGFHRARSKLRTLCRGAIPADHRGRCDVVNAITTEAECSRRLTSAEATLSSLCRGQWKGAGSDFKGLIDSATWLKTFHHAVNCEDVPADACSCFTSGIRADGLAADAQGVTSRLAEARPALQRIVDRLRPDPGVLGEGAPSGLDATFTAVEFARTSSWLESCGREPRRVLEVVAYNRVRVQCVALDLESFCVIADRWPESKDALEDALLHAWCEGVLRTATRDRPALAAFERTSHENLVEEFRKLDREMILVNRERVRARHRAGSPFPNAPGATGVLREQINLNRRHRPIRWLMRECAGPIQALKPVFMMSPLSIAMFLPPDGPRFDLVVFDEASQVRPQDAVGALLRGSQAVVVGDSHQLPPTSFFENTLSDGDEDDEDGDPHVEAGDMESILSLMRARGAHVRDLQWHYRSRHAGLIRVSSHEFYRDLQIFPSPDETVANGGLRLNHLPGTIYGRGGSRTNLEEAKAVGAAVLEHAKRCPHLSLGVAAFSMAQQMAILRQVDALRRENREIDAFENAHPHEPLFIKNLENVQGDERDVILISVGYGRDDLGRLTQNFGPVNQDGGERRLNVLISRARERCEVFSNFTADDLPLPADASRGLRLLKTYLKFAETGDLDVPSSSGREAQSPFEDSVLEFLRRQGHSVESQVGSVGYFIDLAVVDPNRPGRYLLGIECDGAQYHSARSARDRDRLREQVLRNKGWNIHRIWSTSWFHENDREQRRLLAAIETARAGDSPSPTNPTPPPAQAIPEVRVLTIERPSPGTSDLAIPYSVARIAMSTRGKDLHEIWVGTLAEWLVKVVAVESPVHVEEALRRIREATGVQRAGNRVRGAFDGALRHGAQKGALIRRGEFLWSPGMEVPPVRDRSGLPAASRGLDLIAPEEIRSLIVGIVTRAFSIEIDELAGEVVRLFGFGRLTAEMRTRIGQEVDALVGSGALTRDGVRLQATPGSGMVG